MSANSGDDAERLSAHTLVAGSTDNPFLDDDPFAEDGDDTAYRFSSEVLRAELARTLSPAVFEGEDEPQTRLEGLTVSGLTLDARDSERSVPTSVSPSSPTTRQDSLGFQQISLDDGDDNVEEPAPSDEPSTNGSTLAEPSPDTRHSTPQESPPQQTVVIDVSQTSPTPIEVNLSGPGRVSDATTPVVHPSSPEAQGGGAYGTQTAPSSDSPLPPLSSSSATSQSSPSHKHTRSTGPSKFEQVVSKTRPSFLPPKPKVEDVKHMQDWEQMMKRSRAAEEKKRKALQERRLAREAKIEDSLYIWEKEIVPNWKVVRDVPRLRTLWWAGIPTKLRSSMWASAVGNALALSKDTFRICLSRANRALAANTFPKKTLDLIEEDVRSTLPRLHIFHPEMGPLYQDLKELLYAWVVARSDEGLDYERGVARVGAMIVLNMPLPEGFVMLRNLLERHCMRSFYGGASTKADVDAYYRIFDTLLADGMPKIYFNFKQHQISPSAYLPDWILPLFLDHLPFEACARLWDVILLEGDSFVYRASLAILAVLEPRLFFPDRQELLELLRGENKPAIEVARRDGRPLDGGKYEIYGVDEEILWDRITSMDDWWKDSTWQRLLQRELPDI